eukprot:GHRQ01011671.1.p1 GENE.GHRQ01011671.1~~GHRQ01011671.1.p1  ORF type:complete len:218 (+),score=67.69 GHRQ01011671.1:1582-2235(+)
MRQERRHSLCASCPSPALAQLLTRKHYNHEAGSSTHAGNGAVCTDHYQYNGGSADASNMCCFVWQARPSRPQPVHAVQGWRSKQQQLSQQQQQQQQLQRHLGLQLAGVVASLVLCSSATAVPADVFATKCAGCHVGGGNIVQAGATLFQADLLKNGVADSASLYQLIYAGKGRMPGFGQDCAPKGKCTFGPRLADEEVQQMTQYVLDQAANNWQAQQ